MVRVNPVLSAKLMNVRIIINPVRIIRKLTDALHFCFKSMLKHIDNVSHSALNASIQNFELYQTSEG